MAARIHNLADSFLSDLEHLDDHLYDNGNQEPTSTALMDEENVDGDDLGNVSKLHNTRRYIDTMRRVEEALEGGTEASLDVEQNLIADCSALSLEVDEEILKIHNFIRGKSKSKFPNASADQKKCER